MQQLKNLAAKMATGAGRYDSATIVMCELYWLPIRWIYIYKLCIITYKAFHGFALDYLAPRLHEQTYKRNMRASE